MEGRDSQAPGLEDSVQLLLGVGCVGLGVDQDVSSLKVEGRDLAQAAGTLLFVKKK